MSAENLKNTVLENGIILGDPAGFGVDSQVYKSFDGKLALKFYTQGDWLTDLNYSKTKLLFYKTITNKASSLIKKEQKKWKIKKPDGVVVPLEINTIDNIFISKQHNCVVGVSKFIEGFRLHDFDRSPYFDVSLYSTLWGEIENISHELNSRLETFGIVVSQGNIKITYDKEKYRVIITDLCPSISCLRKTTNGKI